MTAFDLAALALRVLDAQRQYFKSRTVDDLIASKNLEKELRLAAQGIIHAQREIQ